MLTAPVRCGGDAPSGTVSIESKTATVKHVKSAVAPQPASHSKASPKRNQAATRRESVTAMTSTAARRVRAQKQIQQHNTNPAAQSTIMSAMTHHMAAAASTSAANADNDDGDKLAEFSNEELQEFAQAFKVENFALAR